MIAKTLIGRIVDTPETLNDQIRVSVPNLTAPSRVTYGPMAFAPIVSGQGGTRIPNRGDIAIIAVDEGTDVPLVITWHRADPTAPPYSEEGGGGPIGPAGPEGPQGPVGPIGPQGAQGIQGVKGDTGVVGPQGVAGPVGPQGIQGPQGVKGDKGDTGNTGPMGTVYDSDQISTVKMYSGKVIPTNWMLADGRLLARNAYPDLADALGVAAGANNFNIPDYRNRFIYGATDPTAQGATGGEATHVTTVAEMPSHNHNHPTYPGFTGPSDRSLAHQHTLHDGVHPRIAIESAYGNGAFMSMATVGGGAGWWNGDTMASGSAGAPDHLHGIFPAGGGAAHNNMPPYIVAAFIIKVTGVQINSGGALVGPQGPPGVVNNPDFKSSGSTAASQSGPSNGTAWTYNLAGSCFLDLNPGTWRIQCSSMMYSNVADYVFLSIWNETDGIMIPNSLGDGFYINANTAPYATGKTGVVVEITKVTRVRIRVHPNGGSTQTIPAPGSAPIARMEAWLVGPGPTGPAGFPGAASVIPLVSALPAGTDGLQVDYQNAAMAANGIRWRFVYRAASTSLYKWEFVGGSSFSLTNPGDGFAPPGNVWGDAGGNDGLNVTLPLAGDYDVDMGALIYSNVAGISGIMSLFINGAQIGMAATHYAFGAGYIDFGTRSVFNRLTGMPANGVLRTMYQSSSSAGAGFQTRWLEVKPVRVG